MSSFDTLIQDLVIANRILAKEDVVDAYGHVSVRHPDNPSHFLIARSIAPELVTTEDIDVRASDVIARRLHANLAAAADRGPTDFPELLLTPGVGARTVRALAMVADVVHGTRIASRIPRDSPSRTVAKTGIRFPCRSTCATRRYAC